LRSGAADSRDGGNKHRAQKASATENSEVLLHIEFMFPFSLRVADVSGQCRLKTAPYVHSTKQSCQL